MAICPFKKIFQDIFMANSSDRTSFTELATDYTFASALIMSTFSHFLHNANISYNEFRKLDRRETIVSNIVAVNPFNQIGLPEIK